MTEEPVRLYSGATDIIGCYSYIIRQQAGEVSVIYEADIKKAVALFCFVRDQIKYNPFMPRFLPEHFRVSNTLEIKTGFCPLFLPLCKPLSDTVVHFVKSNASVTHYILKVNAYGEVMGFPEDIMP